MPYSYATYTGNGSTTQFDLTFPYIRKEHVKVYVDYVDTAFTWVNDTRVQLASAPANGLRVEVRRLTPVSAPLVDYTDGSTLVAADLDTNALQQTYINQEQDDNLQDTVSVNAQGLLDAGGQRITNVGNPTLAQDVATKSYVDTTTVALAGDTMTGNLAMSGNRVTGLGAPTSPQDAATKTYVDGLIAAATIADADYGDITVSGGATVWTIDNGAVTSAKIADGTIVDGDISASAEIAVSKLADGAARQLLQTDAAGTGVEWTSDIQVNDATISALTASSLNGGPLAGTRNRIINGDMRIDQRNAGGTVIFVASTKYCLDRWFGRADSYVTNPEHRITRATSSPPAGFTHYADIDVAVSRSSASLVSTNDEYSFGQAVEGFNVVDLGFGTATAKSVALSFWVKSNLTGNLGCVVHNSARDRSYPFTYTINAADTWEYKTATIPGDTAGTWLADSGVGLGIRFQLAAGSLVSSVAGAWTTQANCAGVTGAINVMASSSNYLQLTGVQLEPGTVATPFERRSYGQELALCQRYAYAWGVAGQQLAAAYTTGLYSDANQITMHPLGVNISQMRAIPTNITLIGTQGTDWAVQTASGVNQTGFSIATNIGAITANKAGHGLAGNAANLQVLNSNGRIIISSEL